MLNTLRRTVLLAGMALSLSSCARLHDSLLESTIRTYTQDSQWEGDNLYVFFGGTGVVDSDTRAGSSVAIVAGGEVFIFDCGPGSTRILHQGHVPIDWLQTVFLTHLHSDHFGDLGHLTISSLLAGRSVPLTIYGPKGTQALASGFQQAYARDLAVRIAQHSGHLTTELGTYQVAEIDVEKGEQLLLDRDGIQISSISVDHSPVPEALAYKVEYGGRKVVLSGDTSYHRPLADFAKGADLLIHEAMDKELAHRVADHFTAQGDARLGTLIVEAMSNHASPADAGRVANEAQVEHLILTHLSPPLLTRRWRKEVLRNSRQEFSGPISLAKDGMMIALETPPSHEQTMMK